MADELLTPEESFIVDEQKVPSQQERSRVEYDSEGLPELDFDTFVAPTLPPEADTQALSQANKIVENDRELNFFLDAGLQTIGAFRDASVSISKFANMAGSEVGGVIASPMLAAAGFSAEEREAVQERSEERADVAVEGTVPEVPESERVSLQIARPMMQFLAPFAGLSKAGKAMTLIQNPTAATSMAVGAVTDLIVFDEHEKRMADALEDIGIENPLAADPDDSEFVSRLKTAVEGAGMGALFDGIFKGVKYIHHGRKVKAEAAEAGVRASKRAKRIKKTKEATLALKDKRRTKIDIEGLRPGKEEISIKDQIKMAEAFGTTPDDIRTGDAFSGLRTEKMRNKINSFRLAEDQALSEFQDAVPDIFLKSQNGDKVAARAEFTEMLSDVLEINGAVKDNIQDIARIQGFRGQPGSSPVVINKLLKRITEASDEQVDDIMAAMSELKAEELDVFLENMTKNVDSITPDNITLKDMVDQWFMNSILSSPETIFRDTVSNLIFTPLNKFVEKPLAAGIGGLRRIAGSTEDRVMMNEAGVFMRSIFGDASDAVRLTARGYNKGGITGAGRAIKDAVEANKVDNLTRFGKHRPRGFITSKQLEGIRNPYAKGAAKLANSAATAPTALMQGKDDIMKASFYRSVVKERAVRRALNEGLSMGTPEFETRVARLSTSPIDNIADNMKTLDSAAQRQFQTAIKEIGDDARLALQIQREAVTEARQLTFTDTPTKFSQGINTAIDAIPGGRMVVPFITTIDNLTRRGAERTPGLSLVMPSVREALAQGGAARDEAIAKMVTGSAMLTTGYQLALSGKITGEGPRSRADREALLQTGWRPDSVFINGKYIPFGQSMGPLALLLRAPARLAELGKLRDGDVSGEIMGGASEYVEMATYSLAGALLSQSWTAGLSNLLTAIQSDDEEAFGRYLDFMAASFVVPNAVTFMKNQMDDTLQASEGTWESIKAKSGFEVRPRRDVFGDPITRDDYLSVFLPIRASDIREVPEWKRKLYEAGAYPTRPGDKINVRAVDGTIISQGIELTPDQYEQYIARIGELAKPAIKNFVEGGGIEALPKTKKGDGARKMITSLYAEAKKLAEIELSREQDLMDRAVRKGVTEYTTPALMPLEKTLIEAQRAELNRK